MKLGELRRICDRLLDVHGEDLEVGFVYPVPHATQRRTRLGKVTSYEVSAPNRSGFVHFHLNYARGPALAEEEKP